MRLALALLTVAALAQKPKDSRTPEECAAIHRFNVLARAEVKGMKEAELEAECAVKPAPKKLTCKPGDTKIENRTPYYCAAPLPPAKK